MFLLNKIIKNVGLAHGFKTINHVQGLLNNSRFIVRGLGGPYKWF